MLRTIAEGQILPLVTIALFLEYEEVLKRRGQREAHGLDLAAVDRFLAALARACEGVDVSFRWRPQLADPGEELVLEAAVNGRAKVLVTYNVRHVARAAGRFGLTVMRPGELLKERRR